MRKKKSNSKDKKKLEIEREPNWNLKYNNMDFLLKPRNLRQESNNKIISRNGTAQKLGNKQSLMNSKSYSILHRNHTSDKPKNIKNNTILFNDPLYNQIKFLWEQLGINKSYQFIFDNFCIQLSPINRENYFNNEINHLNSILNLLKEINLNINKRKNYIGILKKNDNMINSIKNKEIDELIHNIRETLNELRRISIIIIENYSKLKELIGYDLFINKFESSKINNYNSYLIEMKTDLNFLISSNLSKYFFFIENDPFLNSISKNINIEYEKNNDLQIEKELNERVKICEYILLNEILNNEHKKNFNYRYNNNLNNISTHSLISTKSNTKLNKSIEGNYLYDYKLNKRKNSNKKMISNKSINSFNIYNKKKSTFKKKIPFNILTESKFIINNCERNFSKGKLKYEEAKTDIPKGKIEVILDRKKLENEKNKNQRNNKNSNYIKDDNLTFDYYNKIQYEQQNISKKSDSKNELSAINQSNINEVRSETMTLSKNDEDTKDIIKDLKKEEKFDNKKDNKIPLVIKIYSGSINDFISIFKSVVNQIPDEQKIGFQINNNLNYYLKGVYPNILIIEEENNIKGLSIVYFDPIQLCKSLNISLICTIESEIFSECLNLLKNFCTDNFEYDELRLDLFYGIKEGQFYLIETLEKIIKGEKFKWVNMENDGKNRKIKYKYSNPNLSPESILNQSGKSIIKLKTLCIISLDSIENKLENTSRKMNELNNFSVMSIIEELIVQYDYRIEDTNMDSKFQEFLKNLKPNKFKKMTSDFIQCLLGSSNEILSFLKENSFELSNSINNNILNNDTLAISLLKVESSFETIIQTNYNGYKYNIITNENIEVFSYKKNENDDKFEDFYFLRTSNDILSLIIYELKDNSSLDDLINMNSEDDNIYDEFQRVYTKMNNQPLKSMKRILIPSFQITKENMHKKPSFLNAIQLSNNDEIYQITYLNQFEKFDFSNDNNLKSNLIFEDINTENDIIIKNDFLMVLINSDLFCDLQIPTISAFIVHKKCWQKEEKN